MINKQNVIDTISRKAVTDAIEKCHKQCCREDANGDEWIHYETTLNEVESIPPAKVATDINVGDKDTISRKAAIEEIERWLGYIDDDMVRRMQIGMKRLPPAQPVIVPCDYVKACNAATMDKLTSAVLYLEVLEELKKHGYVLVDMRGTTK